MGNTQKMVSHVLTVQVVISVKTEFGADVKPARVISGKKVSVSAAVTENLRSITMPANGEYAVMSVKKGLPV